VRAEGGTKSVTLMHLAAVPALCSHNGDSAALRLSGKRVTLSYYLSQATPAVIEGAL